MGNVSTLLTLYISSLNAIIAIVLAKHKGLLVKCCLYDAVNGEQHQTGFNK